MGYDITYHPLTPEWAERAYFSQLAPVRRGDLSGARAEGRRAGLDEGAEGLYEELLGTAASWDDPTEPFERRHGMALCASSSCFFPYWYTRGSSFTDFFDRGGGPAGLVTDFGEEPALRSLPPNPRECRITQNYRSGMWLGPGAVRELLGLLGSDPSVSAAFEASFPEGQAGVVRRALGWAADHGTGLMEAADLVVPDPLDPRGIESDCWLYNLDLEGVIIYARVAEREIREAGAPYDDMVAGVPRWSDVRQDPEEEWQRRWEAGARPL